MVKETVIFALTSSTDLASRIARELGLGLGKIKVEHFADGEIMVTPHYSEHMPSRYRAAHGGSGMH